MNTNQAKKPLPFNQFNPLPLLLISSLIFQKWKVYAEKRNEIKIPVQKKRNRVAKTKIINNAKSIHNSRGSPRFAKNIIPEQQNFEEEKEKTMENLENELPIYPCTKNTLPNFLNE